MFQLKGLQPEAKTHFTIALAIWAIMWLIALLLGSLAYHYFISAGPLASDTVIEIPYGDSLDQITKRLKSAQIIESPFVFKVLCWIFDSQRNLKAGTYQVPARASMRELIFLFTKGKELLFPVTIPEGLTSAEIIQILVSKGLGTASDYTSLLTDTDFLQQMHIPASRVEGFLFPDTYFFRKNVNSWFVLETMVNQFHKIFADALSSRIPDESLTDYQVLILASLIEKESAVASERPLISRVYRNRLQANMLLQCDPTVIYGLPHFNGNLTKVDLAYDSSYNTYKYKGLPPTPICNPGAASLRAAIVPATGNWLYFVARQDGSHEFNDNLTDHNRAVYRYQIRKQQ